MAFKMKGSAFKLGNVATKSALKHKVSNTGNFESGKAHNEQHYNKETGERQQHGKVVDGKVQDKNWTKVEGRKKEIESPAKQKSRSMKKELKPINIHPEDKKTTTNTKDAFKEIETERLKGKKYTGKRSKGGLLVEEKVAKAKEKGGPKMKSPLEQTSFTDKVKSGVSAIWDNLGGSHESGKKRNVTFSDKVMRSYNKNKKAYRDADRKKKMNK
jgi:hypothetical protein